jgi:HSP20 family protein
MTYYLTTPYAHRMRRMMQQLMEPEWENQERQAFIPIDVKAEDDAYVVTALVPGIRAEDLNIQIVNETLTIQGEIKNERDENANYLLSERPSGKFNRSLTMPEPLDASKVEAEVENGILTLRIPKAEEAKPKTIKVITK